MNRNIVIAEEQIREFCEHHHIHRLAIFGSALGDDFGPESDVDVLVDFARHSLRFSLSFYNRFVQLSAVRQLICSRLGFTFVAENAFRVEMSFQCLFGTF